MSAETIIHAVVLNWRTAEMSLRSARATLLSLPGPQDRLYLVDNASGDGSEAQFRQALGDDPRVKVLQSGRNGGYGFGNNVGMRAAMAATPAPDFIFLVNSDAFPEPDAAERLAAFLMAHPKTAAVGSGIVGQDGAPHCSTFRFHSVAGEFEGGARFGPITRLLKHAQVPILEPQAGQEVDWLSGAALMLRRDALEEVGLFDEGFFLYFEETDLCRRLANAGWEMRFEPEARVVHIGSVTTGMARWRRVPEYWFDSRARYFTKHGGRRTALLATLARMAGGAIHRLRCLIQRRRPNDPRGFHRHLLRHTLSALRRGGAGRRRKRSMAESTQ